MRAIKLMPDYDSFPLWEAAPDAFGNIDPETLPISTNLKSRLAAWSDQYDATLNSDDPLESGFADREKQTEFENEGHALAEMLRQELGGNFQITVQV